MLKIALDIGVYTLFLIVIWMSVFSVVSKKIIFYIDGEWLNYKLCKYNIGTLRTNFLRYINLI